MVSASKDQEAPPLAAGRLHSGGFTLIELMIVIAIIAIIAAIAIPSLLSSQVAANERNCSASLKTVTIAEMDFKTNDRDKDGKNNFWSGNISGLYKTAAGEEIKLVEISIAMADTVTPLTGTAVPKAGYLYHPLTTDENGSVYDADGAGHNDSKFGVAASPEAYGTSGKLVFIVNESNTMFKKDFGDQASSDGVDAFPADPTGTGWATMD